MYQILGQDHLGGLLFLGSLKAAQDPLLLEQHKICSRISLLKQKQRCEQANVLCIGIKDEPSQDISKVFQMCFQFIRKWRKQGNVLVHCRLGVSRSPTIILYYLMRAYSLDLELALSKIQQISCDVNPNEGFLSQLRAFQVKRHNQMARRMFRRNRLHSNLNTSIVHPLLQ